MASDIQNLAAAVDGVSSQAITINGALLDASHQISELVGIASKIQLQDVRTEHLVRELAEAADKLKDAQYNVEVFGAKARMFSRHLASGGGSAAANSSARATTIPDPNAALRSQLESRGMTLADVDSFDFSDNPILDWNHGSPEDTRWAVERWNDRIAPGLASGATREDFEAEDAQTNAQPMRKLAMVWDMFLGSDPIVPDGSSGVTSGRHRIFTARALGIRFLPARKP